MWRLANGGANARWAAGLKFVQFIINSTYHSGINTTPCEAVYGKTASRGITSTSLPSEILRIQDVISEDAYDAMCAGEYVAPSQEDEFVPGSDLMFLDSDF